MKILYHLIILSVLIACEQATDPIEEPTAPKPVVIEDTIEVKEPIPPIASFYSNRKYAMINDTVYFINTSIGDSLSLVWYFGDGNTSTDTAPFHIYRELGSYQVSLVVSNHVGVDSIVMEDSIRVEYFVDFEGNSYKTVIIGEQEWMAENMRSTIYPDGTEIRLVEHGGSWGAMPNDLSKESEAYCHYKNIPDSIKGALYTYPAAIKLCPDGWRLPSKEDAADLSRFVMKDQSLTIDDVAPYLKSKEGWCKSSLGYLGKSLDTYGLNVLPTGRRRYFQGRWDDIFTDCQATFLRLSGVSQYNDVSPGGIELTNSSYSIRYSSARDNLWRTQSALTDGIPVRCMRDVEE